MLINFLKRARCKALQLFFPFVGFFSVQVFLRMIYYLFKLPPCGTYFTTYLPLRMA